MKHCKCANIYYTNCLILFLKGKTLGTLGNLIIIKVTYVVDVLKV